MAEYGEREEILKKMAEMGKAPPALLSKPHLIPGAEMYYSAFMLLHGSRIMGSGPIPISEILSYALLMGIDSLDERADLLRFVTACDRTWLKHKVKKDGSTVKPKGGSRLPGRR